MDYKQWSTEHKAIKFLVLATAITLLVNILFLLLPSSATKAIYGTIQFLWPALSIWILLGTRSSATDKNVKYVSAFLALALVAWTASLVLWEVLLPIFYNNELAYYVSGFGFLLCYGIIIAGLLSLKRSKQWYINQSTDRLLGVIAVMGIVGISAFVLSNAPWNGPRFPDILILLSYLILDVVILVYCAKLMHMNLGDDLRYLILIIAEFVLINSLGDLIYELRWVFSINYIFSVKTGRVTDIIYNVSLIFMVAALLLYNSGVKKRALEEVNKNVHREKHLMDDVVMQSPEAMCICDSRGNITLVNDTLLGIFNTRRSDMLGNFDLFEHMARMDAALAPCVARLKCGEGVYLSDISIRQGDGSGGTYHLSAKIFPVSGPDGVIASYVCIINDITERLNAQKELVDSKRQAELYVDLMAHDINNMNQIAMGFLELAENVISAEGKLEARHMSLLDKPIESLNNSSKLIDNVKKLQKEKSGTLAVREMEMGEMLRGVKKQFENVPGRDITVEYRQAGDCRVMANDLLQEVFTNLTGNAIKHSQGPLNVDILLSRVEEGDKCYCKVVVEDNGPGIPDSVKARIFSCFEPGGPPRGKGLGLYLARTLVDDHNGTIRVEDRVPGDHRQGSRFIVLLPAL